MPHVKTMCLGQTAEQIEEQRVEKVVFSSYLFSERARTVDVKKYSQHF